MAFYKQYCIHCDSLINRDARFCPNCGSPSPFGYRCPTCLHPIQRGHKVCSGCGRPLTISCPHCGQETFVADTCEKCHGSLLIKCENVRCGEMQFFENAKCTACGKKLKRR